MWKKSICGLTALVAGLLIWSCGDGSVDSLNDNELMMISRFPSTIDYDMLDRVVEDCKRDQACWDKALKTGEIYQGDYTKVLRDSSGNIVVVEGDSAYIWKDGKKLPVFDFSSNSAGYEDDDVPSSSGSTSGSSSKGSSASVFEKDEGSEFGDDPNSSGSGGKSRNHAEESSSSRNGSGNSSSIDASQYTNPSSSSLGTYTGSMSSHGRSSASEIVISANTEVPSSSSVEPIYVSVASGTSGNSSSSKNNGTGSSSASAKLCGDKAIEGTCTPNKNSVALNEQVTWTYTPDPETCSDGNIEWQSLNDGNIKGDDSQILTADGTLKQSGGLSFVAAFSTAEKKEQTIFFMDGKRFNCLPVTVSSP